MKRTKKLLSFVIAVTMITGTLCLFTACSYSDVLPEANTKKSDITPDIEPDVTPDVKTDASYEIDSSVALSVAAFKPFDSLNSNKGKETANIFGLDSGIQLLSDVDDTEIPAVPSNDDGYLHVSYHFDSIKIINPVKFSITIPADLEGYELIRERCGTELDVVIAEFTTYEKNDTAGLMESIDDTMIVFRGEKGYFNLLLNSYYNDSIDNKTDPADYYSYSSHKTLGKDSVEKDIEPPIYTVVVKDTPSFLMLTSVKSEYVLPASPDVLGYQGYIQIEDEKVESLNESYIYDLYDLNEYNKVDVDVNITDISSGTDKDGKPYLLLTVERNGNLETVYVTERTAISSGDMECLKNNTALSARIVYASMYVGYDPTEIEALSLSILTVTDGNDVQIDTEAVYSDRLNQTL